MRYLLPILLALGLTTVAVFFVARLVNVTSPAGLFVIGVVLGSVLMPVLRSLFEWLMDT